MDIIFSGEGRVRTRCDGELIMAVLIIASISVIIIITMTAGKLGRSSYPFYIRTELYLTQEVDGSVDA